MIFLSHYQALYRKYRPKKFNDIAGQQHIIRTLKNAVLNNRISHAYIFCGPRGTGKTTTAKVLAKALNCINLQDAEPCNLCKNCAAANSGASLDIIEIDAASNRGIEDIRELREEVKYSPVEGRYRIYIIDEVHMLTIEAFNALLKTLEEPPEHVIFILATTEPQKVPPTILSRCQRFDFRRISVEDMLKRLKYVAQDMGINANDEVLRVIVDFAEGGLRDALSILEQCSVFGQGNVTLENIYTMLGVVDKKNLKNMTAYLLRGDAKGALELIDELFKQGKDLRLFVKELCEYLRKLLLYLISKNADLDGSAIYVKEDVLDLGLNTNSGLINIVKIIEKLARLEYDMKWSSQPKLFLELAVIDVIIGNSGKENSTSLQTEEKAMLSCETLSKRRTSECSIIGRSETKEISTSKPKIPNTAIGGQLKQNLQVDAGEEDTHAISDESEGVVKNNKDNEENKDFSEEVLKNKWEEILNQAKKIKLPAYGFFREAEVVSVSLKDASAMLTVGFKPKYSKFHKVMAEKEENKNVLSKALSKVLGGAWSINITDIDDKQLLEKNNILVKEAIKFFGKDKVEID